MLSSGFDVRPDGKVLNTFVAPVIKGEKTNESVIYFSVSRSAREGRENVRHLSNALLEAGKLQNVFFGEALARRGINEYLGILERDPGNPVLTTPAVVEGTAENLFKTAAKWKNRPLVSIYLKHLLDDGKISGLIPDEDISKFYIQYWAPGIDPVLPLIKTTPTGAFLLGSALFRDDRMVGKLDTYETFLLRSLGKGVPYHIHNYPVPGMTNSTRQMSIRINSVNVRKNLTFKGELPYLNYRLKLTGQLEEFPAGQPLDLSLVEKTIEDTTKKDLQKLWFKLRRANSDPLGVGDEVRARHNAYWRSHDWRRVFPKIRTDFRVQADIQRYGVIR